ncbi:hypothetical protein [Novosphingobium sp. PY1]|uniref:Chemotaxis response regulator protein-glutamate methylesterase n=1 Tax=Ochrobactrum sp. PW1 TaxID=1882222 RepID=A0A292GS23_9HYPH|nr:hypothetical protein [Novosphingobium sp. PY1]BBA74410.1 chemotaxis response regulator protein-glutamate methylesterase [Ochrobactrum sp. PW1]GFM29259.1 chemotaxis response regulator protein-glutamate methylesterase [Novosphingobium sp. PY1]
MLAQSENCIKAQADPAALRADQQMLRQWAIDQALRHIHAPSAEVAIAYADKLVDFVNGKQAAA